MGKNIIVIKREDIIWALQHQDEIKANDILMMLCNHSKWNNQVLHRCPLCGYENITTNIHRHCPEAPLEPTEDNKANMAIIMYVVDKENPVVIE